MVEYSVRLRATYMATWRGKAIALLRRFPFRSLTDKAKYYQHNFAAEDHERLANRLKELLVVNF